MERVIFTRLIATFTTISVVVVATAQEHIEYSPRLKKTLTNKATAWVERMPDAQRLSVQLWLSTKDCPNGYKVAGWCHLLEHLMASGKEPGVDKRLEARGMFLTANSYRDGIRFEISGDSLDLKAALKEIKNILSPPWWTKAEIIREAKIIDEELAFLHESHREQQSIWYRTFESKRPDVVGTGTGIRSASVAGLLRLHQFLAQGSHILLLVAGDVRQESTLSLLTETLAEVSGETVQPPPDIPAEWKPATGATNVLGIQLPGCAEPTFAARFAAILGLQSKLPNTELTYTPAAESGVASLTFLSSDILREALKSAADSQDEIAANGVGLAKSWALSQTLNPSKFGATQGLLWCNDPALRLEKIQSLINAVRLEDVQAVSKNLLRLEPGEVLK